MDKLDLRLIPVLFASKVSFLELSHRDYNHDNRIEHLAGHLPWPGQSPGWVWKSVARAQRQSILKLTTGNPFYSKASATMQCEV